jgi:sugar lactone lactonase YvrE
MNRILYFIAGLSFLLAACKKNENSGGNAPLTITGILPSSGLEGTLVSINGKGFGADTLTNAVTFNGQKTSIFQVTDTTLVVIAPTGGTTGPVVVTVRGQEVKAGTYTYQALSIHGATPLNGPAGTNVAITGAGFVGKSSLPVVTFNGRQATVTSANDTTLIAAVPDSAGVGPIAVQLGSQTATGPVFTYQHINTITPLTGGAGTQVSIHGVGFGTNAALLKVDFNGTVTPVISVTADSLIVVKAPAGVKTGPVSVTINNEKTVGPLFTEVPFPTIATVTPSSGLPGAEVVITGTNFSTVPTENQVSFNGTPSPVKEATATQLTLAAPAGATSGAIVLSVNQQQVSGPVFKFQVLNITAITPNNGLAGNTIVVSGNGFDAKTLTNNKVFFNGLAATVTGAMDTQLVVTVPPNVTTGPVSIQVGTLSAQGPVFSHAGVTTVYETSASTPVTSLAAAPNGSLYFTESGNSSILALSPSGTVATYAGNATVTGGSATDGTVSGARFSAALGQMRCDAQGNLYVADNGNNCIREITAAGTVKTLVTGISGTNGFSVGNGGLLYYGAFSFSGTSGLFFYNPADNTDGYAFPGAQNDITAGMALDAQGNIYYVGQYNGGYVDEYTTSGTVIKYFSGFTNATSAAQDPTTGMVIVQDGGARSLVQLNYTNGTMTTLYQAANYGGLQPIDGTLAQAGFSGMNFITIDYQGAIYVVDGYNSSGGYSGIRKIVLH